MNEVAISHDTLRIKSEMRISVFVISVPKIIDVICKKKESNTGFLYRWEYPALG
jgi:hypothetical protein